MADGFLKFDRNRRATLFMEIPDEKSCDASGLPLTMPETGMSCAGRYPTVVISRPRSWNKSKPAIKSAGPIPTAYQGSTTEACGEKFQKLVQDIESHGYGEGKRRFVRSAPTYYSGPSSRSSFRPLSPTSRLTNRCTASVSVPRSWGTRWRLWPWPLPRPFERSSIPR